MNLEEIIKIIPNAEDLNKNNLKSKVVFQRLSEGIDPLVIIVELLQDRIEFGHDYDKLLHMSKGYV